MAKNGTKIKTNDKIRWGLTLVLGMMINLSSSGFPMHQVAVYFPFEHGKRLLRKAEYITKIWRHQALCIFLPRILRRDCIIYPRKTYDNCIFYPRIISI